MNWLFRRESVAAMGAALVFILVLGREAAAERLYTERPAELRRSPGDDSQVVRRIGKGKSLEVVKRLGTWVMVEYEGRTGWIRRTALANEPGSGSSADAGDEKDRKKSADRKKDRDDEEAAADEDSESEPKAGAAGAKRTAAKKKAERRKSRKARHEAERDDESKASDDDEEEATEDTKPRRPRSTWGARGRLPGGPLKVEIQAISAQAFSEPDGGGKVVFTVSEGDRVRVIARGENRWLLVENGKKRTGWIPATAVRDSGLLPEARKDVSKADEDESESEAEEAPDAEEEEVSETKGKSKKTRTADASDEEEEDDDGDGKSSRDEEEASLTTSSDEELVSRPKPWTATASLRAGFTAVGMDVTPTGAATQNATYSGPTATLAGELSYRVRPKISVLGELTYDWSTALGGMTYTPDGGTEEDGISLMTHRVGVSAGVGYGKRAVASLRLGYQYWVFQISDIDNPASWPRESTAGPTAGLGFTYPGIAGTKLGARIGLDAMLLGSRSQTEGRQDGPELDSLTALWGTARVDYPIGKSLSIDGGYRFGYAKAAWTGASERTAGAMDTERKDQSHEISVGLGWRL
jgi:uncharacterized protein YgiM (DUF1202 family)